MRGHQPDTPVRFSAALSVPEEFFRHGQLKLSIDFGSLKAPGLILEQMQLLSPSLQLLAIFTGRHSPYEVINYDLSFLSVLKLTQIDLLSFCLPIDFLRKVISQSIGHLSAFHFSHIINDSPRNRFAILVHVHCFTLRYFDEPGELPMVSNHPNLDSLIEFMQTGSQFSMMRHLIV